MKLRFTPPIKTLLVSLFVFKIVLTLVFLLGPMLSPGVSLLADNAIAQETETAPAAADLGDDPAAAAAPAADAAVAPATEEIKLTLASLEEKRLEIEKEKERLAEEKAHLESLKEELALKIDELSKIRQEVEAELAVKEKQEDEKARLAQEREEAKLKHLVKVYTSMKPRNAAALIDKLDMAVVLKLFSRMKGEQIGKILTYVNVDRAALVSEQLARKAAARSK